MVTLQAVTRLTRDNIGGYIDRAALIPQAESRRLLAERGRGIELGPLSVGALETSVREGGLVIVGEEDGREGERIFIWAHEEPEGWFVSHAWGPSERHFEVLLLTAAGIVGAGGADAFSHYPNSDLPICALATRIVKPEAGRYEDGVWTPSPRGRLARVNTLVSLARLQAASAPSNGGR